MDIDYLKDIGRVEAFPISIDSSIRDKRIYPSPSDYEVELDVPLRNVVGFDVLDASIPNTMYVVDEHNRRLSFTVLRNTEEARATELLPGARGLDAYLARLADAPAFVEVWGDAAFSELELKICGDRFTVDPQQHLEPQPSPGTPVVITDVTLELDPLPDSDVDQYREHVVPVDMGRSYLLELDSTLGEYFITDLSASRVFQGRSRLQTFRQGGAADLILVSAVERTPLGSFTRHAWAVAADLLSSPLAIGQSTHFPGIRSGRLESVDMFGIHRVRPGTFSLDVTNPPFQINSGQIPANDQGRVRFLYHLHFYNLDVDMGDHDVNSLVTVIGRAMPGYVPLGSQSGTSAPQPVLTMAGTSLVGSSTAPNYTRQRKISFESGLRFWMDMGKSTIRDVLGFQELARDGEDGYVPYRIGDNDSVFASAANDLDTVHRVLTPGLVTALNERLVVLRCPQIEENAYPSLAHSRFSTGLGVFKLYNETVAHLRFDFTKLARLDFHPIGTLSKLRLRFETLSGRLYNFRGVEHHLFMAIRFIIPKTGRGIPPSGSRLNPDYDPDILRYEVARRDEHDESDTESDDDLVLDREHAARYQERRRQFLLLEEMRARRRLADGYKYGSGGGSDGSGGSDDGGA